MDRNTLFITSQNDNPAFNLAAEEVLLRNHTKNIIFFYINSPSVIVGKHQNTLSEINLEYLEKNDIPVYRRLSGGGTVYHDKGNINYCIIENGKPGQLVDFVRATTPVVEALKDYGVDARHGKRNDLLAGFKKISGNACHVYKSRAMHHGTLLFNSNLEVLTESLKADAIKFKDKSVKSVRSEVINISQLINTDHSIAEFLQYIGSFLEKKFNTVPYAFSKEDLEKIEKLKSEKYNTWKWNYGYSPVYEFSKRIKSNNYIFASKLKVQKGIISEIEINTNHPEKDKIRKIAHSIRTNLHNKKVIQEVLNEFDEEIKKGILLSMF
ncbi:lipoate--protein ligase family protein [Marinilabilia rubra]|uniref:lipoate--protein ligase n=1 Tax=Marinilabilia rubra TaxID=2162893 RepID=A0A2U2B9J5_9BACT|nr:biotin/lipoate A/B protein ligase family protein [Marinilabilia rubra]PWD99727.1 lipoate--protein ligase [Marinilabilia rubra]